jgi:hypothetical protein
VNGDRQIGRDPGDVRQRIIDDVPAFTALAESLNVTLAQLGIAFTSRTPPSSRPSSARRASRSCARTSTPPRSSTASGPPSCAGSSSRSGPIATSSTPKVPDSPPLGQPGN